MIDPRYTELMNLELDGTATAAESKELHRHLSSNPAASAHFEGLGGLVRRLDAEPLLEPPAELHPRIMAAVDHAVRTPAPEAGFAAWLSAVFAPRHRRTLSTFGLGLATGVFLLAAVQFGRPGAWDAARGVDPSMLSGTMAHSAAEPLAEIALDPGVDGLGGSVELKYEQGVTVIEAHLEAPDLVYWTLGFDPGLAARTIEAPSGPDVVFGSTPGEVYGRHSGTGNYRIVLSGRAEPVESVVLKVVRDGDVVVERAASPIH